MTRFGDIARFRVGAPDWESAMKQGAYVMAMVMLGADAGAQTPAPARMTAAECAVWNRELSFARSVEAHDAAAFVAHLQADAVFNAGTDSPVHGRTAIADDWKAIIEGKGIVLRWHPGFVSIGGNPGIALSSGPAWIEHLDPKAKQRYTISRYTSTWVKDADGEWRVLFDGAGAPPSPASADEVRALEASLPTQCPGG